MSILSGLLNFLLTPPDIEPFTKNEIAAEIDGSVWRFWTECEIKNSFDNFSTFMLKAPFDPTDKTYRDLFRPYKYKDIIIYIDGKAQFTGTIVNIKPDSSESGTNVTIDGYAKPAILADVVADPKSWPVNFTGLKLEDIINTLGKPYDVTAKANVSTGQIFKNVAIKPDQKIYDFISKLAKQRGVYISNDVAGNLILQKPTTESTTILFNDRNSKISLNLNGQEVSSELFTVGGSGGSASVENPMIESYRPGIFKAGDTNDGALKDTASSAVGRQIANAVSITVEYPNWQYDGKTLFKANTLVEMQSPINMCYNKIDYLVRNVTFKKNATNLNTLLDLCFPECYNNNIRSEFPWDEPTKKRKMHTLWSKNDRGEWVKETAIDGRYDAEGNFIS